VLTLLPTPSASRAGTNGPQGDDDAARRPTLEHLARDGRPLALVCEPSAPSGLLPTPAAADGQGGRTKRGPGRGEPLLNGIAQAVTLAGPDVQWGPYEAAVRRWEKLTRPVPAPTELGQKGRPRLAPAFSEWMQGLPAGWVSLVPGLTRNDMLTAIGNGVVPRQAEYALWVLIARACGW
jgi:DNA (cytosine-5)-methyltransferase 1